MTLQGIRSHVAHEHVGPVRPGQVQGQALGHGDAPHRGRQERQVVVHGQYDRIVALAVDDPVPGIVDHVGVVACAAGHRVGPDAAVDPVAGRIAVDRVVQAVTGQNQRAAGALEVLDLGPQGEVCIRDDLVDPSTGALDDHIAGADVIGIVAKPSQKTLAALLPKMVSPKAEPIAFSIPL